MKSVPLVGASVYQYDLTAGLPAGHVKETTWDVKGNITEREYDKLGRMLRVTSDGETVEYQYYQDGNRKSVVYPSASETYTYDAAGQLLTLENRKSDGTLIDSYGYTYDAAGNQLSKTDAKGMTSYTYDSLHRLIKVAEPGGKVTEYTYDKAGNRKTEKVTDGTSIITSTYEYNAQNRLLAKTQANSDGSKDITRYNYDNNGNLIYQAVETLKPITPEDKPHFSVFIIGQTESEMSRRVVIYAYDNFNQLISAKTGGTTAEYAYNGEGLRVKKIVNGETTIYLYEYDQVVLELDQYGRQKARNVYGINLLTREVDGEKYYYLYNGHADVTVLVDASTGLGAASYYYDAFGNILGETGAVDSPILFAGYQYDEETGLYYLNARMYDPKIARFLQEDTYRGDRNDPLSLHLYAYCFNNPLRYFDPTGHMGVGVRTAEEAAGNKISWKAGTEKGKSTIIVTYSDGTTAALAEGTDYEIGTDGKAYYVVREVGLPDGVSVTKDTGNLAPVQGSPTVGRVIHDVINTVGEFIQGAIEGFGEAMSGGMVKPSVPDSTAQLVGQAAGNAGAAVLGTKEMGTGLALTTTIMVAPGGVAVATGTTALGLTTATHGAVATATGIVGVLSKVSQFSGADDAGRPFREKLDDIEATPDDWLITGQDVQPSTKGKNKGGLSIEIEYTNVKTGETMYEHVITRGDGSIKERHFRPYPKQLMPGQMP